MAAPSVTTTGLDHEAIAKGIGELKIGGKTGASVRVVANGQTIAWIKPTRLAVQLTHVERLPKKLGVVVPEANGRWGNVVVKDTAAARALLEYVARAVQA